MPINNKNTFGSLVGSSLKSGVSSFLGGAPAAATDFLSNLFFSRRNYNIAEKAAQNQYNRQLDFWNKQNAYNDPKNVLRRWQNAGINPLAVVSGGAASGAGQGQALSSVPGNDYALGGMNPIQPISPSAIFAQAASIRKLASDANATDITAGKTIIETEITQLLKENQITKNEYDALMLSIEKLFGAESRQTSIEQGKASAASSRASANLTDVQTGTAKQLQPLLIENQENANALQKTQDKLYQAQISEVQARISNTNANTALTRQNIENLKQQYEALGYSNQEAQKYSEVRTWLGIPVAGLPNDIINSIAYTRRLYIDGKKDISSASKETWEIIHHYNSDVAAGRRAGRFITLSSSNSIGAFGANVSSSTQTALDAGQL